MPRPAAGQTHSEAVAGGEGAQSCPQGCPDEGQWPLHPHCPSLGSVLGHRGWSQLPAPCPPTLAFSCPELLHSELPSGACPPSMPWPAGHSGRGASPTPQLSHQGPVSRPKPTPPHLILLCGQWGLWPGQERGGDTGPGTLSSKLSPRTWNSGPRLTVTAGVGGTPPAQTSVLPRWPHAASSWPCTLEHASLPSWRPGLSSTHGPVPPLGSDSHTGPLCLPLL